MPYGNRLDAAAKRELDLLYEEVIKSAVESVEVPNQPGQYVSCHRADKDARPGEIVTHIIENLVFSEIAIADLTKRNSNVFYELGIRHAVNDNTILIAQNEDDIPVDLRGQRYLIYSLDFAGGIQLRKALIDAVRQIVRKPDKVDNPVRRFLCDREKGGSALKTTCKSEMVDKLIEEVKSLHKEMKVQTHYVERIMEALPSPTSKSSIEPQIHSARHYIEGVWRIEPTGSRIYVRNLNGALLAPYRYSGITASGTGHFFAFRAVGVNLLARFEWFNGLFNGYAYFENKSEDVISGGWWLADCEGASLDTPRPPLDKCEWTLIRVRDESPPAWVNQYFEKAQEPGPTEEALVRKQAAILTTQERKILSLTLSGLLGKELAAELGLDEETVKHDRLRAMDKLGVRTPMELEKIAGPAGLRKSIG